MKRLVQVLFIIVMLVISGCWWDSTDRQAQGKQENMLKEAFNQIGLPKIINFQEYKLAVMIAEQRDRTDLICYAYIYSIYLGKFTYIGKTIGYGLPYSTQITNPEKVSGGYAGSPQAEPNGLFMPESADATWIMLIDENGKVNPQYMEERVEIFTYKLQARLVIDGNTDFYKGE